MTTEREGDRGGTATDLDATVSLEIQPPAKRRPRFRLTLSLRAMMVLVLISGIGMAWKVNRARATRRAVAAIRQSGGYVQFNDGTGTWDDKPWLRPPGWLVHRMGEEYFFDVVRVETDDDAAWGDRTAETLASFPALQEIRLLEAKIRSPFIGQLARMSNLREIVLHGNLNDFSDVDQPLDLGRLAALKKLRELSILPGSPGAEGLEALATLPELRKLSFGPRPGLGEAEIEALGRFDKLESLSFSGRDHLGRPGHTGRLKVESWRMMKHLGIAFYTLSEDEMKAIANLPRLEELSIHGGETEDEHLMIFAGMTGLKKLRLESCYVTPEGVAALQQRLPSLAITGPRFIERKMPDSLLQRLRKVMSKPPTTRSSPSRDAPGDRPRP